MRQLEEENGKKIVADLSLEANRSDQPSSCALGRRG
jgi:hypothetical protein